MVTRPKNAARSAAAKPDFAALLAGAKLPERTVPICMRGDLAAEHEQLNDELELLEKKAVDSLAGNGGAELAARIEALEVEMRDSTYVFRLRGMPGPQFRAFEAKHPIRVDDDGKPKDMRDVRFGFNVDTGADPLVRASIIDPEIDEDQWAQLTEMLTNSQFESLFLAAWLLNKGDIDVPFSRAASRLNRLTGDDSKQPTA